MHRDLELCFSYFPLPEGTRAPARRPAVGRRAADAVDQPRADGPAEAAAARRAVARPVAASWSRRSSASSAASTDEQGVAILLVEQNAHMALQTAEFGYVLEVGRIVLADDCATADADATRSRNSTSARRKPASADSGAGRGSGCGTEPGRSPIRIPALVADADRSARRRKPFCARRTAASGRPITWAQLGARVREVGLGLTAIGFRRGRCRMRAGRDASGMGLCRSRHSRRRRGERRHPSRGRSGTARRGAASSAAAACCSSRTMSSSTRCSGARPLPGSAADRHLRHEGSARLRRSDVREPGNVRARGADTIGASGDWDAGVAAITAEQPAVLLFPHGGGSKGTC